MLRSWASSTMITEYRERRGSTKISRKSIPSVRYKILVSAVDMDCRMMMRESSGSFLRRKSSPRSECCIRPVPQHQRLQQDGGLKRLTSSPRIHPTSSATR